MVSNLLICFVVVIIMAVSCIADGSIDYEYEITDSS